MDGSAPDDAGFIACHWAITHHPRIIAAFGHGHYGITQGPTTGRIVADLVHDKNAHIDLTPFAMDRF